MCIVCLWFYKNQERNSWSFFKLKIAGMVYIEYRGKMHFPKLKSEIFVKFSLLVLKCRNYLKWNQKAYLFLFKFV